MRTRIPSIAISGAIETGTEIVDTRQITRVDPGLGIDQIGRGGVTEATVVRARPSTVAITIDRLIEMTADRSHAPGQQTRSSLDEVGLANDLATEIEAGTKADHDHALEQGKTAPEAKTQ